MFRAFVLTLAIAALGIASSPAFAVCMANGYGCNQQQQRIIQNMDQQQQQFNRMRETVDHTSHELNTEVVLEKMRNDIHDDDTARWCSMHADTTTDPSNCY
jgi:hypothetical protein